MTDHQIARIKKLRNLKYSLKNIATLTGVPFRDVRRLLAEVREANQKPKSKPANPAAPGEAELRKHAEFLISLGYDPDVVRANFG